MSCREKRLFNWDGSLPDLAEKVFDIKLQPYQRMMLGWWPPPPKVGQCCQYQGPGKTELPCEILEIKQTDRGPVYKLKALTVTGQIKVIENYRGNLC